MSLNSQALFDALQSHALASGLFDRVNTHEPKNAPGNSVTYALYLASVRPVPSASGLAATSGLVTFVGRIYKNMLQEPQDGIDPDLLSTVDAMFAAYSGDFTLGGTVMDVDLLGHTGTPLSATAGYIKQDEGTYRTVDITLPLVVADLWTQAA